jgi:hypothetical protein
MNRLIIAAGAAFLVSGCGGEEPQNKTAAAAELSPGQYEASWKITQLRSTDKTTPATNLKQDMTGTTLACVGPKNAFDPVLFAEDGDECTEDNRYARNGRINLSLTCKREGAGGEIRESVNGTYKADNFEAEVSVTTYLGGDGDYALMRTVTGKRVGECPPTSESAQDANAASG